MRLAFTLLFATLLPACSAGPTKSVSEQSGKELYATYCASCHGKNGRGTFLNLGPTYEGIKRHWTKAKLLEYIADPKAYAAKDERLGKRDMAAIADDVPPAARERLVEYALTLMD